MDQVVKIHWHFWRESLAKFENDLLQKNEDILAW